MGRGRAARNPRWPLSVIPPLTGCSKKSVRVRARLQSCRKPRDRDAASAAEGRLWRLPLPLLSLWRSSATQAARGHSRKAVPLLVLILAAFCAAPAAAQIRPRQVPGPPLQVRVDLVPVIASVLDAAGKPVTDLPESDFRIFQDNRPQKIDLFERQTNLPLDLALMIDTSLSAAGDLKFEREAAGGFLRQVLRPGDRMAVFSFAYDVDQLSPFTAERARLDRGLREMEPGTGTSLFDAIVLGSHALARRPAGRRRVLLLVTDAGETTSRASYEQARDAAIRSGAMLYTMLVRVVKSEVGENTGGEHAIDTIIDTTGGAMFPVDTAAQFAPTFSRINEELRTEYLIGYYPKPAPAPGSEHSIQLELALPAGKAAGPYTLTYRKAYFAPEAQP